MRRIAALSLCFAYWPVSWCGLARQFAEAAPPAEEKPFDVAPPDEAAKPAAASPFDEAPAAAHPFDPAPSTRSKKDPTLRLEGRIRQALAGPTLMDFTETPLQDATDYLRDLHGIEIQLDNRAFEDAGIGSDTPITRTVKGLSLASALRLLLDDLDSTFVVRGGVLLITTKDAAQRMVDLRVYNISDLVSAEADAHELAEALRMLFTDSAGSARQVREGRRANSDQGSATTTRRAARTAAARFEVLPYRSLLIVQASQHDHEELDTLLDEIKAKLEKDD